MKIIKSLFPLFVVIALSYWSISNIFITDFFQVHDNTQVQRVFVMAKSLQDGIFPVRWVSDLGYGYGYPIFNFYAPLSYYFGATLSLVGFDVLLATKLMMAFGVLIAGIAMYLLGKTLWGKLGGIVSALFYIYAPYHAVNVYVRGAIGELWAYGLLPLVFYSLLKLLDKFSWKYVIIGAFAYSGIILSHNLFAFMLTPFLLLFIAIYSLINKNFIHSFISALIIGLGLSSFYILPAVFETKYTNVLSIVGGGADFRDHFVCLQQLWSSYWGFGGSIAGCIDGMSFMLGKLHILTTIGAFILFSSGLIFSSPKLKDKTKKNNVKFAFLAFSLIGLIFSIIMMLNISQFIWESIPYMEFLQYPWRFLNFVSFFLAIFAGFFIWRIEYIFKQTRFKNATLVVSISVIIMLIYANGKLFTPQASVNVSIKDLVSKENLSWTTSKISDEYMPSGFIKPLNYNEIPVVKISENQHAEVLYENSNTAEIHASIKSSAKSDLMINIAYFPGWVGYLDNKKIDLKEVKKGMSIEIPEGVHSIDLFFVETPIEKLANSISLAFLFIVFVGIIFTMKRSRSEG